MTVSATTGPPSPADPDVAGRFLRLVGDGDEYGAVEVVTDLLDDGVPPQRIMVDLIGHTQSRVGELWAANEWTIAREHAATAISERVVAAGAARISVRPTPRWPTPISGCSATATRTVRSTWSPAWSTTASPRYGSWST